MLTNVFINSRLEKKFHDEERSIAQNFAVNDIRKPTGLHVTRAVRVRCRAMCINDGAKDPKHWLFNSRQAVRTKITGS